MRLNLPRYYVNKKVQPNGDHEVHDFAYCPHPADIENRLDLGFHTNCQSAVLKAKQYYPKSNGCFYCCKPCHTT